MKEKDFIVGNWYKFKPYESMPNNYWYFKFKEILHNTIQASIFIGAYENSPNIRTNGNMGAVGNYNFQSVTLTEQKWCELCVENKEVFDINLIPKEEIINNYSIY